MGWARGVRVGWVGTVVLEGERRALECELYGRDEEKDCESKCWVTDGINIGKIVYFL